MNHSIPERKDTDPRFHWHIEDYFKTDADWEAAYSALEASIPEMAEFSGKLADSAETLLACLQKNEVLSLNWTMSILTQICVCTKTVPMHFIRVWHPEQKCC